MRTSGDAPTENISYGEVGHFVGCKGRGIGAVMIKIHKTAIGQDIL